MSSEESRHTEKVDPAAQRLVEHDLNTVTGGNWSRVKSAPIVGKRLQGVENGLADRIKPKYVDPASRKRPDGLGVAPSDKKPDEAGIPENNSGKANPEQRIQDVNNNRTGWLHRKGRKKGKKENKNDKNEKNEEENSQESNDTDDDSSASTLDGFGAGVRKIKRIILISAVAGFIFTGLFIVMCLFSVFGLNIAQALPAVAPMTYNTSSYQPVYEEGTAKRKEEEAYYEKLSKYQKNEGVKISYIHAVLIYKDMMYDSDNGEKELDFKDYSSKVEEIYKLMKSSGEKTIDYEKYGTFYNNLKDSDFFREYYKDLIIKEGNNGAVKVLDELFDFAKEIDSVEITDDTTITEETKVVVKPTTVSPTPSKIVSKETKSQSLTVSEYIANSIYANTDKVSNNEMVKAYTVVYSTNIVAENKKLTVNSNEATMSNKVCSIKIGCSFDINGNLVDGPGIQNNKNTTFYNGNYYYKRPLSKEEIDALNKNIESVMGNVLANKDGTYPSLDTTVLGGLGDGDGDYKSILSKSYGNEIKYKNIGEGSYDSGTNYGAGGERLENLKSVGAFYEQKDYSKNSFCGLKSATIASSGCGVSSMAMIATYYEKDASYTPVVMNSYSTKWKTCGGGGTGTKIDFFRKMSKELKYNYIPLNKSDKVTPNMVISHLLQGHLIIARMGPGTFTSGGHYIVLAGVRPDKRQVYVYDPNNRTNVGYRHSGNGWYSFNNVILKEARNFFIIYK